MHLNLNMFTKRYKGGVVQWITRRTRNRQMYVS